MVFGQIIRIYMVSSVSRPPGEIGRKEGGMEYESCGVVEDFRRRKCRMATLVPNDLESPGKHPASKRDTKIAIPRYPSLEDLRHNYRMPKRNNG